VSEGAAPRLAVFDLDGTLTRSDTLVPFVVAVLAREPGRLLRLPGLLLPMLAYAVRLYDRGTLKGAALHLLLGGLHRRSLEERAVAFAHEVLTSRLHAQARPTIEMHRAAGDRLVLLSASPDLYVPRIAELLGFHECLCTAVRWSGEVLDGRLAGPNCRGAEKSHRLQGLRERHPGLPVIAYGNSSGDLDHLRRCEAAVYVNAGPLERARLSAQGLRLVRWQ
jgi:phosphatidylglycerophosphatase C